MVINLMVHQVIMVIAIAILMIINIYNLTAKVFHEVIHMKSCTYIIIYYFYVSFMNHIYMYIYTL